ncbi:MAG: LPS assembly lipoprotein LptE [Pirellulales bacterium]|jgi:hypothetical protein
MILTCRGEGMSPTAGRAVSSQTCEPSGKRWRSSSLVACVALVSAVLCCISAGCAGYRVGNNTLYAANVRTVYVPLFQSDSYRTTPSIDIGERITEAVCKEIERRTPFKVVGTAEDADSVLTGRVVADTKRMVVESPTDQSRMVEVNYQVLVTWADRGGAVLAKGDVPLPAASVDVGQAAALVPEYGRSVASTQQEAIIKIAQQVVGLMEEPW